MAKVNFIRRHTNVEVDEEPIVDGNFIVTGDGGVFIDYGTERIAIGGSIIVDSTMSDTSTNPVQNKVVKEYTDGKVKTINTKSDIDTYSCNYVNDNMQKHMLSASFTADIEPTPQQYVELSNWSAIETTGNKLSIKNGKIVVGTGVSKIKISGILGVWDTTNQLIYVYGKKNGANINTPWVVNAVLDYHSMIYNNLISVKEGDIISIAVYGQKTYKIEYQKSLFIFEVVE